MLKVILLNFKRLFAQNFNLKDFNFKINLIANFVVISIAKIKISHFE